MNKVFGMGLIAFCMVIVSCLAPVPSWAQDKVIKLRFAEFGPPNAIISRSLQGFATEVERRTNERVKITIYWGGTLIPATEVYDGVAKEVADMGHGIFSYSKGRFPMMELIDLPLGYTHSSIPTKLINAYYKKFKPKELNDVKVLFLDAHGPGALATKKPVNSLEQVKGMKIRAHSVSSKVVSALGGAPVGLSITDTYDAISKGVVDGVMNEPGGLYAFKLGEVVNCVLEDPAIAYSTAFYTVMNKDKWNSLPKDIQNIIDQVSEEWGGRMANTWIQWDDTGTAELKKKGIKFLTLPKSESDRWAHKTGPVVDAWVKDTKAKGLPGDEAVRFCRDFLKAHQK